MKTNNLHRIFLDRINNPNDIALMLPESDPRIDEAARLLSEYGIKCLSVDKNVESMEFYIEQLGNLKFAKNWPKKNIEEYLSDPIIKSLAMLRNNEVSGVVCGCTNSTANVIRSAIRIIGMSESSKNISSMFLMISNDYKNFYSFADCAVIPEPSPNQLAEIALKSSELFQFIVDDEPQIAFLSFSTDGSADHYRVKNVQEAVKIFSRMNHSYSFDGEIQLDAAINPDVALIKSDKNKLNGNANILIFPNLDAGNIGYKLAQYFGNYFACGPFLLGLRKPVNDLSRGSTVDDIVLTSLITALQSERMNIANI